MSDLKGADTLSIFHEALPAAAVVRVCGDVDLGNVGALRQALDTIIAQRHSIVLDCAELSYIDSAGFHVLFRASQALKRHGCRMLIAGASPSLRHAFGIINIEKHVPCVASVTEALDMLNERA